MKIGVIQKFRYGFLFAFHSSYGDILYRLRDIASYWSKIAHFYTPPVFSATTRRQYFVKMFDADKTRMVGLPCSEETMTIH